MLLWSCHDHNSSNMLSRTKLVFDSLSAYRTQVRERVLRYLKSNQSISNNESHEKASELSTVDICKSGSEGNEGKYALPEALRIIRKRYARNPWYFQEEVYVELISEATARNVAAKVKPILDKNRAILECNAGRGILSKALLANGMKKVVALEKKPKFHNKLQDIENEHPKSYSICPLSLGTVLLLNDDELSTELKSKAIYKTGDCVQIVGQIFSWGLLAAVARQMRRSRSFLSDKCVNLCVILPEGAWNEFRNVKFSRRSLADRVLFALCFDSEILMNLKGEEFNLMNGRGKTLGQFSALKMVLLQAKSKPITEFDVEEFEKFLKQFYNHSSRHRIIISSLERWAPSCGEELVRRGLPVFAKFSDLTPVQLLEVYLYFKTLPNVREVFGIGLEHSET